MTPKLRVLVSSSDSYPPTTACVVNSSSPTPIKTPHFEGQVSVFVKNYHGDKVGDDEDAYFGVRKDLTYSMVVKGRFLDEVDADQVVFGNVFEKPVRDHLPWGTSIATKFMYFIDPTLELDIYADKPWALSPALATMTHLAVSKSSLPSGLTIDEDAIPTLAELCDGGSLPTGKGESARRKWLGSKDNRKRVKLGPDVHVGMEFGNGLLDFTTLSATLPPPFKLSVPLLKYWDGQPVTYVCQRRNEPGQPVVGDKERVYWSVAFEIVDEEAKKELERKGGKAEGKTEGEKGDQEEEDGKEEDREDEGKADDVD